MSHVSKSARIRARLNHPIIDSDGHTIENATVLAEYIKSVSGSKTAERFVALGGAYESLQTGGRAAVGGGLVIPGGKLADARDCRITRGTLVGDAGREYAGPCDRDAAEAVVRTTG
jgi:hypothetical protein